MIILYYLQLNDNELGFYDTVIDFNFKLSWGEYQGENILSDAFLSHVKRIMDSNGFNYYVLDVEYNFIQLCLHAYKEANGLFFIKINQGLFLRAFLDIYYYIIKVNHEMNLELVLEISQRYKIESYVYFVLKIVDELFCGNECIRNLISMLQNSTNRKIVEQFGLENEKIWDDITIKERFFSSKVMPFVENQLTDDENSKIEMVAKDFY